MNKSKITIIGCGWLGLPLCAELSALGHKIITTTTDPRKNENLNQDFVSLLFDVTKEKADPKLFESDILIYTIPPLGKKEVEFFFETVDRNKKIIFISSTSVYGKNQGIVTEDSPFDPASQNALVLRESEQFLKKHFKNLTIIRPGGLYDDKRHPVYFLAGKTGITTGEEFLHLVHRNDCVFAIKKIIELNLFGEDFNLISDLRILKKDYYIKMANKLGLAAIGFVSNPQINPTNISNKKSKEVLLINYKDPTLF